MIPHIIYMSGEDRRFLILNGDLKRNRERYPILGVEHFLGRSMPVFGYGSDANTNVENIIDDLSEPGDSIIFMTDLQAAKYFRTAYTDQRRKVTIKISDFDLLKKETAEADSGDR